MRVLPAVSSDVAAVALAGGLSVPAAAAPARSVAYVVELTDPPVAIYDGGTQGIPAARWPSSSGRR